MASKRSNIGHYEVVIHEPRHDTSVDASHVKWDFNWAEEKRPLFQAHIVYKEKDYDQPSDLAYGRGKSIREHEESHLDDYIRILEHRQPTISQDNWDDYNNFMHHTRTLLDVCSNIHTDRREVPYHPNVIQECKDILEPKRTIPSGPDIEGMIKGR